MYIRRKVFSVLNTEEGDRLFSLDQKEFTGETKRRNKALKRQWLRNLGGYDNKGDASGWIKEELERKGKPQLIDKIDLNTAGRVSSGRLKNHLLQEGDILESKENFKHSSPGIFEKTRELDKKAYLREKAKKSESKLSKLAKNKYAKGAAAGLLVLGGTAGGYYLLNKKNKKDKEDKE